MVKYLEYKHMEQVTKEILKEVYAKRTEGVRKYDFGLLTVIGGSEFYSGSPALSALSAFKAGVDMVRIIAPKRAADIIASFSPNMASFPLDGDRLNLKNLDVLLSMTESAKEAAQGKTAVVLGGGVGRSEETKKAIQEYLREVSVPVVIDADAIYAVSKNIELVSGKNFLFTPHSYEFLILTGRDIRNLNNEERIKAVEEEAKRLNTTIVLKGKVDIISNGKDTVLNYTGSPYMTKGGMGDTLAGIAGAVAARGIDLFKAGCAAAYINGLAGDLAAKKYKESVTATDLIDEITNAIS